MHQQIVQHILYPLLVRCHGSQELAILAQLRHSERFSADELHGLQLGRLQELLRHAGKYVPFYQRRFAETGFDPSALKDFGDLEKLPILTRSDAQERRKELISTFFRRADLQENRTGGSTGTPVVFYHDRSRRSSRQAATLRHNAWAGYHVGCKTAILWGHQGDLSLFRSLKAQLRNKLIDRHLICDSGSFSEETLTRFARDFKSFRPEVILAYANSLALVVDFCVDHKIELPSPRSIITSAEVLTPENRQKVENYFGTKVFDRYGSRETSVIASECEAHDGLHINAENLYLEFISQGKDVAGGETGEVIVTDLGNFAFPFIRYQIGDYGAPVSGMCPCGRTLPKMRVIAGRTTDFLLAQDGRKVSGAALAIYLAAKIPGVRQAQIVQRERSKLIFNLVIDRLFDDSSQSLIRRKVDDFFGAEMSFTLNFVESIPRETSGKYRFSICELESEEVRS
jgi:phenylacetate-CoA ligase